MIVSGRLCSLNSTCNGTGSPNISVAQGTMQLYHVMKDLTFNGAANAEEEQV